MMTDDSRNMSFLKVKTIGFIIKLLTSLILNLEVLWRVYRILTTTNLVDTTEKIWYTVNEISFLSNLPFLLNVLSNYGQDMNSPQANEEIRSCNFVINHEGRFKVMWDWIVLVLVIFTAIQLSLIHI